MLTVLSSLVLTSALLVAPEYSVSLVGADTVECNRASVDSADACFVGTSSVPISLEVRSSDGKPTIHKVTFGVFQTGILSAIASGQLVDGKGLSIYLDPLPLPQAEATGCASDQAVSQEPGSYVIQTEIGTGEEMLSRQLLLEIHADQDRPSPVWAIGDTGLVMAPKGDWRDMRGHRAMPGALDIEACNVQNVRIVAFIVQPAPGVSLTQYVSNSVEAYSGAAMWRVSKREPSHIASADGEHLSLEQTIGGVSVPIEKYFLPIGARIVILSTYGMTASEARDSVTSIQAGSSRSGQ